MSSIDYWNPKIEENEKPSIIEFLQAVQEANLKKTKEIIGEKSFAEKTVDFAIRTALCLSKTKDASYKKLVELLIQKEISGANLSHVEEDGTTLLMVACGLSDAYFVDVLMTTVQSDKFIQLQSKDGNNCLHYLIMNEETTVDEKMAVLMKLIRQGINLKIKNAEGYSPLALAVKSGCYKVCYELMQMNGDIEQIVDSTGETLLHLALFGGDENIFDLVNLPKLWKIKNKDGLNAYELAKKLNSTKFLKILEIQCQESTIKKSLDALKEINSGNFEAAEKILDSTNDKFSTNNKYEWNHFLTKLNLKSRNDESMVDFQNFFVNIDKENLEDSILLFNRSLFEWNLGNVSKSMSSIIEYLKQNENLDEADMFYGSLTLLFEGCHFYKNVKGQELIIDKLEDYIKRHKNDQEVNINDQVKEYLERTKIVCKLNIEEESLALVYLMKAVKSLEEQSLEEVKKSLEVYNKISINLAKREGGLNEELRFLYKFVKFYSNTLAGHFAKCLKIYKKNCEQASPNAIHYNNGMGILNLKLKKYTTAEMFFKLALQNCRAFVDKSRAAFNVQNSMKIKFNMALSIFYQKRYEEALLLFESLTPYFYENPLLHYRIGLCHMELILKSRSGYSKIIEEVIEHKSNKKNGNYNLQKVVLNRVTVNENLRYSTNIQFGDAIAAFKKAIQISKNRPNQDIAKVLSLFEDPGTNEPQFKNQLPQIYSALIFCLNRSHCWSESLFFIKEIEHIPMSKNQAAILENYKIEAMISLERGEIAKDVLQNQVSASFSVDLSKSSFFTDSSLNIETGIGFKLSLYTNLTKVQLLKNNLDKARLSIKQILKSSTFQKFKAN